VSSFINGDAPYLFLTSILPNEINLFSYCDNNPIVFYDKFGEAKKSTIKAYTSSIFTIREFYDESKYVKSRFEFQYWLYGMNLFSFSDYSTFKSRWNSLTIQDIVVVNCHANPTRMQNISIDEIRRLKYKNIQALILLGCNAGHYDYKYENVAFEFSKKISGCVLASDGTVYSNTITPFLSKPDATWKFYKNLKKSKRIVNRGWVVYDGQRIKCTYLYSITILSAIKYLRSRNLFRFNDSSKFITA
jgi:hypothetical protein